jgi:hypothetical protein
MRLGQVIAAGGLVSLAAGLAGASAPVAYGLGTVTALIATAVFLSQRPSSDPELALLATMWLTIAALAVGRALAPDALEEMSDLGFLATFVCFVGLAFTAALITVRKTRAPAHPGPG